MIEEFHSSNPNLNESKHGAKKIFDADDRGEVIDGDLALEVVEKPGDNSLAKLKHLYTHAKDLSQSEESVSNMLMNQLDALLPSGTQGQQRRRNEDSEKIPFFI
uniref:Uncharacterized protein n=1 Tax=Cannabis sativa TaxID=3483 RepID=A0A803PVS5_CANSA